MKPESHAPIPASFGEYVRSMGPGIITVLTWLSAGDVVGAGTAGGNYGYALMWAFVLCLLIRCLFVSLIAKHPLCSQHSETVLAGLCRLHPAIAPAHTCALVCSRARHLGPF